MRFEGVVKVQGQFNRAAKSFLESIISQDISVHFLSMLDPRRVHAFNYKYGIPCNGVIQIHSVLEIPEICEEHKFLVYYDTDSRVLDSVGTRGSLRTEAKEWTTFEKR